MFCQHCGASIVQGSRFCIQCGKEVSTPTQGTVVAQPVSPPVTAAPSGPNASPKPAAKRTNSRCWLFGVCGTAAGAILLVVILLAAGLLSFGEPRIEGPGFATPEDAAKAYLMGLRNRDIDAMLSAIAVESYVEHYDLEAAAERIKVYFPLQEIRLPNSNAYHLKLNIASRRDQLIKTITNQYLYYNSPGTLNDFENVHFAGTDDIADFFEGIERDTEKYVFADLEIGDVHEPEDVSELYSTDKNLKNIARQAEMFGVDEDDVANVVIEFEADGQNWLFCPQAVRYNGKWYLQSAQGNPAILAGMPAISGGIAPMGTMYLP